MGIPPHPLQCTTIHAVVRDVAELLYHGMDGLDPGGRGPQRPERGDGQRSDIDRTGMCGEVYRPVAAPAGI